MFLQGRIQKLILGNSTGGEKDMRIACVFLYFFK